MSEKTSQKQALQKKSHQRNKQQGTLSCKLFENIRKFGKGRTQKNRPDYKKYVCIRLYIRKTI